MEPTRAAESESSRTSRRLSGMDPEFGKLLGPSRTASRQLVSITSPTQQLEAESQRGDSDEEDEPIKERTPKQTSRLSVPEVVIKQPTPRKAPVQITCLQGTYEINPEDLNVLGHELNKAKNALEEFYMQHRPAATPIEDSTAGFQILVK